MSAALAFQPPRLRESMIARVIAAATDPAPGKPQRVAEAIGAGLGDDDLLAGFDCPGCPDHYVRHLLYACPKGAFSLMALVWMPGQASPLHAHRAWCALGVHSGVLTESFFAPRADGTAAWLSDHRRASGALSFGAADDNAIHRLANRSAKPAISIHAYGLSPNRLCSDLNRLYVA
jgi:predicted metal-dependent enzyme (double-stranded beta helix superfamily)